MINSAVPPPELPVSVTPWPANAGEINVLVSPPTSYLSRCYREPGSVASLQ